MLREGSQTRALSYFWARSAPRGALPVLRNDRPALVVAPVAVDLQVARREALQPEARPLGQRDRRRVRGLDVRLEPVQLEPVERVAQQQLDAFGHVPLAGVRLPARVAEVGVQ